MWTSWKYTSTIKKHNKIENIEQKTEEFLLDQAETGSPQDTFYDIRLGEDIPNYRQDQWFYYESEESEESNSTDEESIMDRFLNDCQEEIFINNEEIDSKTKELLETRISPTNIRDQLGNIILEIYALGRLSIDQLKKDKEKYNLELVDNIDKGKIPFSDLEKQTETIYMMTMGESSKRPKREWENKDEKYRW